MPRRPEMHIGAEGESMKQIKRLSDLPYIAKP